MTHSLALFRRLGGQDAVTWPLFWATFVGSALTQFAIPQPYVALHLRVIGVIAAQLLMFVPLLALHALLHRHATRPHPWLVLNGYALAVAIRAAVLTYILREPDGTIAVAFQTRLVGSLGQLFVFIVTTLIVSTSREHARDVQRLLLAQRQLAETREVITRRIDEQNEAALIRVQDTLSRELAVLDQCGDDSERLQALHRLASDVVRPMSHEFERSVPLWSPTPISMGRVRVDWPRVLALLTRRGPFRPWVTAAGMVAILLTPAFIYLPEASLAFLGALAIGTVVGLGLANAVLSAVLPTRHGRYSIALVVLGALAGAAVPGTLCGLVVGGSAGRALGGIGSLFVAGSALAVALVGGVLAAQRDTGAELRASNRDLRISLVRLRQIEWFHQRALARALHGAMQTRVIAAAFRLEAAQEQGEVPRALIDEVRSDITQAIDVLGMQADQPLALDEFAAQVIKVWSRVAAIDISTTASAEHTLDDDAVLRAIVMEIASESISNAIRHGKATVIQVAIDCPSEDELTLHVTNDGRKVGDRGSSGLGSRLMDDCTLDWHEDINEKGQMLTALFPCNSPRMSIPG